MRNLPGELNVNDLKARLGKVRLFQLAMIASIPMFGRVAEMGRPLGGGRWTLWHWAVAALALSAVLWGASMRGRVIVSSEKALARDACDPKALRRWESGQILGMAFAESIVLWGLVVRTVLGGALWQASVFYAAGFILLLFWTPRMPSGLASN
jgi:F0F1-type ATP synthase membrane subunit c/vacuolar-type H+-ATPase subunit K